MPTPRPFQAPTTFSPLFKWGDPKATAAMDAHRGGFAANRYQAQNRLGQLVQQGPTKPVRMAGGLPAIFNRIPKPAVPIVGTGLNLLDAGLQLSEGRSPEQVAANIAATEAGGALGAGLGTLLFPGPGTVIGGIAGGFGGDLLTRGTEKVYAEDINMNDPETLRALEMYRPRGFGSNQATIDALEAIQRSGQAAGSDRPYYFEMKPFWQRESGSTPPAPPEKRPVEEDHPPVTGKVPPTPTPSPEERTQENDLARFYAKTHMRGAEMAKGGELQRRLWESGEMRGMTPETLMSWVEANPGVAYREAHRRGLLPEYETASLQ